MTSINIDEREKNIIFEFAQKLENERFLEPEDFDKVYDFFKKIVSIEGETHNISFETRKIDNKIKNLPSVIADEMTNEEWKGFEVAGCDLSDELGKDMTIYLDPIVFCKRYFGSQDKEKRLDGLVELIFSIYHEIDHSIRISGLSRNDLSPEALVTAREYLLRNSENDFYIKNYKVFSLEKYANIYAKRKVEEVTKGTELNKRASGVLSEYDERTNLAYAQIGLVEYKGMPFSKDSILEKICDIEIGNFPNLLYIVPILQKQYDTKGKKHNLITLFNKMFEDTRHLVHGADIKNGVLSQNVQEKCYNLQAFYFELISSEIFQATEKDYIELAEKYGVTTLQSVLSNMEKYFNHKAQEKLKCLDVKIEGKVETEGEIKSELKHKVNSIVRFRNGVALNPIAEKLLREGGFIRGTREILEKEEAKRRKLFAKSLVGAYDSIETEQEYRKRAENEKNDIDEVVNALFHNRLPDLSKKVTLNENKLSEIANNETVRFIHLIKIANIMSGTLNEDYFGEFLKIPEVNSLIASMEKDKNGYLAHCMKKAQIRVKKVVYPKTEAEEGKYESYLKGEGESNEMEISQKIKMLNDEFKEGKERRNGTMVR